MERGSESEQLWACAITRDKYSKRLTEKSVLKVEDLEYIRDRIFDVINSGQANIYDPKENERLQTIVGKYLYQPDDFNLLTDIVRRFDSKDPSCVI